MLITVLLPDGKELSFAKGEKGVTKLFITNHNEVVVCYEDKILKFGNMPYTTEFDRKDEDIDA